MCDLNYKEMYTVESCRAGEQDNRVEPPPQWHPQQWWCPKCGRKRWPVRSVESELKARERDGESGPSSGTKAK